MVTLIIGGTRSGKSAFALNRARMRTGKKTYLATATAGDEEMAARIKQHQHERPTDWLTCEEPLAIGDRLRQLDDAGALVVLDCLTLWVANLLAAGASPKEAFEDYLAAIRDFRGDLFIVTGEVGQGIVPDNPLARRFRDLAGLLNQETAALADEVYLVCAGIPLKIKPN